MTMSSSEELLELKMASDGLNEARRQHDIERDTQQSLVRRIERAIALQAAIASLTFAVIYRASGGLKHETLSPLLIRIGLIVVVGSSVPLLITYRPQKSDSPKMEWLRKLRPDDGLPADALANELSAIEGLRSANDDRATKLLWAVLGTALGVLMLGAAAVLEACPS